MLGSPILVLARQNGIVVQVGIFEERVDRVQAEARNAALVPPARDVEHRLLDRGIAPVQVRLFRIEKVVVPLSGGRIELPCGSAESRKVQLLGGWLGPLPSRQMYQSRLAIVLR